MLKNSTIKINYLDFSKEIKARGRDYSTAVDRVLRSNSYILSSEVSSFEEKLAKYLGVKYCVGVANGLEAIQISLMALGVGKDDEVITTPVSAVATTLAILAVGAVPVFADIDKNGQIGPNLVEHLITKKTKAILAVHLYGQPLEITKLSQIAKKYKIYLIEDAAQAHGTTFNGKRAGTFGDISCFSFYPTKNLGAIGDGGAIATNNLKLAKLCAQIRDYGQETKYVHVRYGLNSRLDELQAAILSEKLKYLEKDNKKRRDLAEKYISNLKNVIGIEIVLPKRIKDSNFHLFVIKTNQRDKLKTYLAENGIPSLIHYPGTIPDQPLFGSKYKNLKIPVARQFVKQILSLPCHPFMEISEVDYISNKIIGFFSKSA
jgi:dTDP-4-amino-4,6-dideoxygalactose transaminase